MLFRKKYILFPCLIFLLFLIKEETVSADLPDSTIVVQNVQTTLHQANTIREIKTPIQVKKEIQEILQNVYQLGGLSSIQLPSKYYHFRFSPMIIMPPVSPIGHPISEMIISIPQTKWEPMKLYIRNAQKQWIEYRTSRSLQILLAQLQTATKS